MKLFHPVFSEAIVLKENRTCVIIIENETLFYNMIMELKEQCEGTSGDFVLSKNFDELHIDKYIELVTDITALRLNEKRAIAGVISRMTKKALGGEYFAKTADLLAEVDSFVNNLLEDFDVCVHLDAPTDVAQLFKAMNLSVKSEADTLVEDICNFVHICFELFGKNVFAFVNLKQFLPKEELLKLYKFFAYEKLHLILLEGVQKPLLPGEDTLIIDKDMCVI